MEAVTFARSPWSEVRDRRPWPALVHAAFHAAYLGIGEAYGGVSDVGDKVAAMSRYADDLLACTASAGEDLVGLLAGEADAARLVIYDLFVAPAFRRRGIGRKLVETAIAECQARVVAAEVNRDNTASRALLESMGFLRTRSCDRVEVRQG